MTVVDWLLDADPSIRWQVMRDLADEPADVVARERARVATQGWGAALLAHQGADGNWGDGAFSQDFTNTFNALELLRILGLDPTGPSARRAVGLVAEHVTWGDGAAWENEWAKNGFFEGEVEPCINGNVLATGSYFGQDMRTLVDRLLGEQLADGGWNCEVENGATVSSFGTTINVLEGLLAYERTNGGATDVAVARRRGQEYLLERGLLRRKSTGEVIDPEFTSFSFPTWWHYDVLRGLDYLRDTGEAPDDRLSEAIDLVRRKGGEDGRWDLEHTHQGTGFVTLDDGDGQPSRWNTLRAMRVLRWSDEARN